MKTLYTLGFALLISGATFAQTTTTGIGEVNAKRNSIIKSMGNTIMIETNSRATVNVYDINGRLIETMIVNGTTAIDMSNYNVNTYFVSVNTSNKNYVKKGILTR
jgi:hypothetical protein